MVGGLDLIHQQKDGSLSDPSSVNALTQHLFENYIKAYETLR